MTKRRFHSILLALIYLGMSVQGFSAHWAWVEREVAPVPWDYTAFPMFMAYDKSDQKLTLVINDSYYGTVQVWKFTAPEWILVWEGIPDLGEASAYYHFLSVDNLYYDENLSSLVIWGSCPGYQFETNCKALFKYIAGEGLVKITDCIPVTVDVLTYPNLSIAFDTARKRAVIVGGILMYLDGAPRAITIEYDGSTVYYIRNKNEPPDDIYFPIGTVGYDPNSQRIIFYGKRFLGMPLETWEYDGQSWTLVPTTDSPPTYSPIIGMSFVPRLGGLLALPNDLGPIGPWVYRNRRWDTIEVGGQFEGTLHGLLTIDQAIGAPVYYGGNNEAGFRNRMWKLLCARHCKPVSKP